MLRDGREFVDAACHGTKWVVSAGKLISRGSRCGGRQESVKGALRGGEGDKFLRGKWGRV